MNGKHSFLSGYDDAWDSGSNGVGGHPPVAVITTLGCPHCKRVKDALSGTGIDFEEIELSGQLKLLESIKKTTGRTTVPQVFLGGLLIGGADETLAALGDGSFQAALEGGGVGGALPAHLRDEVDRALQHTPKASTTAIPQPLLPEDMPEERYQVLRAVADSIHTGLVPGGNYMFTLAEGVEWLRRAKLVQSMDAALATLADLQRAHLLFVADGSGADLCAVDAGLSVDPRTGAPSAPAATAATVLQLVQDAPLPRLGDTLNARVPWYGDAQPASQVAEGLRTLMLGLYDVHLAPDGRSVDYPALVRDPNFADYTTAATELQKVNLLQMSRDERMAFFINIYNALVVHAMALFGPAESTIKRLYWFGAVKYNIGGLDFSANDVEHGVLRANAASPTSVGSLLGRPDWAGRQFKADDPRLPLVVEPLDARIHFALVCGAKSCPPIRVYTPASLEAGLEAAAQAFCSGEVDIDHEAREVTMSMIFKWYKADFGPPDVMLPWLLQFLPHDVAHELEDMLAHDGGASTIKISHRPYDWGVNTAEY